MRTTAHLLFALAAFAKTMATNDWGLSELMSLMLAPEEALNVISYNWVSTSRFQAQPSVGRRGRPSHGWRLEMPGWGAGWIRSAASSLSGIRLRPTTALFEEDQRAVVDHEAIREKTLRRGESFFGSSPKSKRRFDIG